MSASLARPGFVATLVIVLVAGCAGGSRAPGRMAGTEPGTGAPRRIWSITRAGERCFTRLADCKTRWEDPACAAGKAEYACPGGSVATLGRSTSAAIVGQLGGAACSYYQYERDIPGYVKKGPARGPQGAKGVRPDGKRWNPPPPLAPRAVPCPTT